MKAEDIRQKTTLLRLPSSALTVLRQSPITAVMHAITSNLVAAVQAAEGIFATTVLERIRAKMGVRCSAMKRVIAQCVLTALLAPRVHTVILMVDVQRVVVHRQNARCSTYSIW